MLVEEVVEEGGREVGLIQLENIGEGDAKGKKTIEIIIMTPFSQEDIVVASQ